MWLDESFLHLSFLICNINLKITAGGHYKAKWNETESVPWLVTHHANVSHLLINILTSSCQDGLHGVAWGQLGASLHERRCWLFLLLIKHSKVNAGISNVPVDSVVSPDAFAHPRSRHQPDACSPWGHTGQRGSMPSPLHLALWNLLAWTFSAWREGMLPGSWANHGSSGEVGSLTQPCSSSHPLASTLVTLGPRKHFSPSQFPFPRARVGLFCNHWKNQWAWNIWRLDSVQIRSRGLGSRLAGFTSQSLTSYGTLGKLRSLSVSQCLQLKIVSS